MIDKSENRGCLAAFFGGNGGTTAPAQPVAPVLGVTWMLLPPYDIPGMAVVSGVLIENQGEPEATGVHIQLTYSGERFITHMDVVSDAPYELEGGSPRDSFARVRLASLPAGAKVVIYVAGHQVETPDIRVHVTGYSAPPQSSAQ